MYVCHYLGLAWKVDTEGVVVDGERLHPAPRFPHGAP